MSHFASRNDTKHVSPTIFLADRVTHRWCFQEPSRYRSVVAEPLFSPPFFPYFSTRSFSTRDYDNLEDHLRCSFTLFINILTIVVVVVVVVVY